MKNETWRVGLHWQQQHRWPQPQIPEDLLVPEMDLSHRYPVCCFQAG